MSRTTRVLYPKSDSFTVFDSRLLLQSRLVPFYLLSHQGLRFSELLTTPLTHVLALFLGRVSLDGWTDTLESLGARGADILPLLSSILLLPSVTYIYISLGNNCVK